MAAEIKQEIELEIGHVLFVDIVGYSKLLINEQRALLETLNQSIRSTDEFQRADAAGRLIKIPTGEGMALVFYTSPEAPVECALEIARADIKHPELELRMGIHSGPVDGVLDVNERTNVAGAGINMAQRVMDCGDAGHILLSKRVAEDLAQYGHWKPYLHDLGECKVKHGVRFHIVNLYTDDLGKAELPKKFMALKKQNARLRWMAIAAGLFALAAILASVTAYSHYHARAMPVAPEKSIAVLPFANLSSDKENAYFADGIQDEILTRLSKIADLKVISRTSTEHYKSAPDNLREIGQQLGVANLLEGSVQKAANAVHINVQLIRAATDEHLWAESYNRKLNDIFTVEGEVAGAIADQLNAKLRGAEKQVITAKLTSNPEASDAYLRGSALFRKSDDASMDTAQQFLEQAVRLDPGFATAWALLARLHAWQFSGSDATDARRASARAALDTALRLQPDLAEVRLAQGYYQYWVEKDYA